MKNLILAFLVIAALASCNPANEDLSVTAGKEILMIETEFANMASQKGAKLAFLEFADDSADINRNGEIFSGKKGIAQYFDSLKLKNVVIKWKPDFVKASSSGDLGYTYGSYQFSAQGLDDKPIELSGIFHTVWRKQKDGQWRFVYD